VSFIVTAHKGLRDSISASTTDAEMAAKLKRWLEDNGYKTRVQELKALHMKDPDLAEK
jgi:hypothetical protein